tara:strand:+ start:747 stop:926 length:180 start_codon:yes stop_codon:yes gene_type:complete
VLAHLLQGILDLLLIDRVVLLLATLAALVLLQPSQDLLFRVGHTLVLQRVCSDAKCAAR